ncbi:MAG: hypothetical protein M1429_01525 [Patescibacteria group bacterium]|nr:hypothetical protein [Patescibacteria group bacterium]
MNVQNKTSMQVENQVPPKKGRFSRGKIFLIIILIFVIYVLGNIVYGNFIKGQYNYTHAGQQIFSFKYPKKYHVQFENYQNYDYITIKKKCSLLDLLSFNFDCGYDMSLRFTIFWPDNEKFVSTPEEYIQKNIKTYSHSWGPNPSCNYTQVADKQICYIGNYKETGIIFSKDYMIEVVSSQLPKRQNDINYMLSTLVF